MIEMPITSAEEKAQRRLELKTRSTLMIGIPNEHQLKFNSIKDAKKLLEAVEKRFCRNAATKKTQRNLLKQQNFTVLSSEMLDQTFDRLQKLKTGRKLTVNGNETIGFDKSKVECYNYHKRGHFAREYRALINQDNKHKESLRRSMPVETSASTTLVSCDSLGRYDWSDQAMKGPNYAIMDFSSSSSDSKVSNDSTCLKSCLETINILQSKNDQLLKDLKKSKLMVLGNFMPPTPSSSFTSLEEFDNKPIVENYKAKSSEEEPKVVRKNDDAPIIKEYVSDNKEEDVSHPKIEKKTVKPSIAKIESSSKVFAPGPIGKDVDILHRKVKVFCRVIDWIRKQFGVEILPCMGDDDAATPDDAHP
nr:hypothetical protein [Tanacetum cinerariifolium]